MTYRTPPPAPRPYEAASFTMDDIRRAFIPPDKPVKMKVPALSPEQFEHLKQYGWVHLSPGQVSKNKRKGGKARAAMPGASMTVKHGVKL